MAEMRDTDPIPTTVLRDTREQHPWTFDECAVETQDVTLSTGDYAVPADCTHDPESDTHYPRFAVERKSGHDFLTALTWERDRFTSELRRAAGWSQPMAVVVETSWQTLLRNRGCMRGGISIRTRSWAPSRRGLITTTSGSISQSPDGKRNCVRISSSSVVVYYDDVSKSDVILTLSRRRVAAPRSRRGQACHAISPGVMRRFRILAYPDSGIRGHGYCGRYRYSNSKSTNLRCDYTIRFLRY